MILYNCVTLVIKKVYDALFSKEKIKLLVGSEVHGDGFVVEGGNKVHNYCKKRERIKKDYNKLQNKNKLAAENEKQK